MDSRSTTLAGEKELGTVSPSPRPSYEKENKTNSDYSPTDNEEGEVTNPAITRAITANGEEVDVQYPEGVRMAAIVVALILSIFLVSSII